MATAGQFKIGDKVTITAPVDNLTISWNPHFPPYSPEFPDGMTGTPDGGVHVWEGHAKVTSPVQGIVTGFITGLNSIKIKINNIYFWFCNLG